MKKALLFALILGSFPLFAQKPSGNLPTNLPIGRLYGKILEASTRQPIGYASVMVMRRLPDGRDTLVGGALSADNGDFNVTGLPIGPLKVRISFVGFQDWIKTVKIAPPNDLEQDLGNLSMIADEKLLKEIVVTAEKASTMISLEKRVFNVEKSLSSTGGTAEDVMKNVPSVTVDMDGNALLRDRQATIYVDGKPSLMALTQIPADQIQSIEVISNPSAKYEASTMGGILNIVLKKNIKPGYNGIVSAGVGLPNQYNGMLNLNMHEGKWSLSGFYNINSSRTPTNGYVYRTNYSTTGAVENYFNQNTTLSFENRMQNGRLSADYAINNRNTLSLSGNIVSGVFNLSPIQNYQYLSADHQLSSYGIRQTDPKNKFTNNTAEIQWKKTFPQKDRSLVVLANYSRGLGSNMDLWTTTGFDALGQTLPNYPEMVQINGDNTNTQGVFQLDYVSPLNDSTRMEMGVRSFWSGQDQSYFYRAYDYETKTYAQDNSLSQLNRITSDINAAYFTYAGRLKHAISYQAGFRFEQSNMTGKSSLDSNAIFGYDYPKGFGKDLLRSFFPSLYLSKKLDDKTEIGLNFSRKIGRPNYRQLMPGIQANDKQNIQIGNPDLEPEFVNLAELNFNKVFGAANWLSTLYVSNETNTLKPLLRPSAADPTVLVTSFVNGTNELMTGLDNTFRISFAKKFDIMLNANVFNYQVAVDTFSNTGWAINGKLNLTYRLPYNFSVQINAAYQGNRPIPQGNRKGIAYADFAVKKSFFKDAANLVFSVNDIFNSRKDITVFTQAAYTQEVMRRRDTRSFKLTLQIPFGKADASLFKRLKEVKKQAGQDQPDMNGY